MKLVRKSVWLLVFLAMQAWAPVHGQEAAAVTDSLPPEFLILPVANYSEVGAAHTELVPRLHESFDRIGVSYMTSEELRPLLRKHRIRSQGWIGMEDARILRRETLARYLLLGSWDIFRTEVNPEIGLSLRVLDLENMTLVGAVSVGLCQVPGRLGGGRCMRRRSSGLSVCARRRRFLRCWWWSSP